MTQFELTDDHIKLIRNMWVDWDDCEYGAPAIDPKRPYGNSDVPDDIAEILGWEPDGDDYGPEYLSNAQCDEARRIHKETQTALQIILATMCWETGIYERSDYGNDWKYLGPASD